MGSFSWWMGRGAPSWIALAGGAAMLAGVAIGCVGAPPEDGDAIDQATDGLAPDPYKARAKVFGYVFGDGNYHPHRPAPRDAELKTPELTLARDFVLAACAAGHDGQILSEHEPPAERRIDCASFTMASPLTKGSTKYSLIVEDFDWPKGGDFDEFVASASTTALKGFISGMIPVEGTRTGLVDDQFKDSEYTTDAQIDAKLRGVRDLLKRLGFSSARTQRSGAACTSQCRTVNIDPAKEACELNPAYGFEFAKYWRVPGAIECASWNCEPPPPCD